MTDEPPTRPPSEPTVADPGPAGDAGPARLPAEAESAPPTARFGKFIRVEKLGQGGMGEVWKAWDLELHRWVALKFLLGSDPQEIARFKREAETAGRLDHPNISAIYEVGQARERHYIAMQYVPGVTLRKVPAKDRRLLVRLLIDAAKAVQAAHDEGIIHRDLKPDNVMVVLRAGGEPRTYVMDFGLARPLESDSRLSLSGAIVGTPAYMPPEQARGDRVDGRADVYALGATLYEVLAGRPPFAGANVYETLLHVQRSDPVRPGAVDPSVDRDLETIVLKCLEKEPERRYENPAALAAELARWLEGEPILARPVPRWERWARRVRRNRVLAASMGGMAGLVLLLAVGGALAYLASIRREQARTATERDRAESQRALAEEAARRAEEERGRAVAAEANARRQAEAADQARVLSERRLAESLVSQGDALGSAGAWTEARACFEQARRIQGLLGEHDLSSELGLFEVHRHTAVELLSIAADSRGVEGVAFHPDGRSALSIGRDTTLRRWDVATGRLLREIPRAGSSALACSPEGRLAAVGGTAVTIWDLETGRRVRTLAHQKWVEAVAWSPDGRRILSAADTEVKLWDAGAGTLLRDLPGHAKRVKAVAISPDGRRALTGGADTTLMLWDLDTGKAVEDFVTLFPNWVNGVAWFGDGSMAVVANGDNRLYVLDAAQPWVQRAVSGHKSYVQGVAVSPDGRVAVSAGADGTVGLWNPWTQGEVASLGGHSGEVNAVAVSGDGRLALSGGSDGKLKLWSTTPRGHRLRGNTASEDGIVSAAFAPDGAEAAILDSAGRVGVWSVPDGAERRRLSLDKDDVGLAYVSDGRALVSWSAQGVSLWNARTGTLLKYERREARDVVTSPRSGRILVLRQEGIDAVDVGTLKPVHDFGTHRDVGCVALSPDGRYAAIGPRKTHAIGVWDAVSGARLRQLEGGAQRAHLVQFSPDGAVVRAVLLDNRVAEWEAETGRFLGARTMQSTRFVARDVSPDGRTLLHLEGERNHGVHLLDVGAARTRHCFAAHQTGITCTRFSPDGRWLVSCDWDGGAALWDVDTGRRQCVLARKDEPRAHRGSAAGVAAGAGGLIVTAGKDGLRLWKYGLASPLADLEDRMPRIEKRGDRSYTVLTPLSCAMSRDGRRVLAGWSRNIEVYEVSSGRLSGVLEGHEADVMTLDVSPDGRLAASGSVDRSVRLWELESRRTLAVLQGHGDRVNCVKFSPDGKMLASGDEGGRLLLWDVGERQARRELGMESWVSAVSFTPDGRRLLGADGARTLRLWDVESGHLLRSTLLPGDSVSALAISRGGRSAFLGTRNGALKLGDLGTWREVRSFPGDGGYVNQIVFLPDRDVAVAATVEGVVSTWDFAMPETHRRFQQDVARARQSLDRPEEEGAALRTLAAWYAYGEAPALALKCFEAARALGDKADDLALAECRWRMGDREGIRGLLAAARDGGALDAERHDLYVRSLGPPTARTLPVASPDPPAPRPFLGVVADVELDPKTPGVPLKEVVAGKPAAAAGVLAGDIITHFDGDAVDSFDDVRRLILSRRPGDRVVLAVVRDGKRLEIPCVLRQEESNAPPDK